MRARKKDRNRTGGPVDSVVDIRTSEGEVRWRVTSRGKARVVKTSKSSTKVMEEATVTYATALARLADR